MAKLYFKYGAKGKAKDQRREKAALSFGIHFLFHRDSSNSKTSISFRVSKVKGRSSTA